MTVGFPLSPLTASTFLLVGLCEVDWVSIRNSFLSGPFYDHSNDCGCIANRINSYMKTKIRIGCGAGFSGDRLDPSLILCQQGNLDYLVLECLAERTIALAQKRKLKDPSHGYDPLLEKRMNLLLDVLVKEKVRLITNMGAANPVAAASGS